MSTSAQSESSFEAYDPEAYEPPEYEFHMGQQQNFGSMGPNNMGPGNMGTPSFPPSERSFAAVSSDRGYASATPMSEYSAGSSKPVFDIMNTGMTPGMTPAMTPNVSGNFYNAHNQYGMGQNQDYNSGYGFQQPSYNNIQNTPLMPVDTQQPPPPHPPPQQQQHNYQNEPDNSSYPSDPRDRNRHWKRDQGDKNYNNRGGRGHHRDWRRNSRNSRDSDNNYYSNRDNNRESDRFDGRSDRFDGRKDSDRYDGRKDYRDRGQDRHRDRNNDRDRGNDRSDRYSSNKDRNRFSDRDRHNDRDKERSKEKERSKNTTSEKEIKPIKPKTPERQISQEDEHRPLSLDSRIQSLLQGAGMADTFGSPPSDSAGEPKKKEQTPPHNKWEKTPVPKTPEMTQPSPVPYVGTESENMRTPYNFTQDYHSNDSESFKERIDRKLTHKLDFREQEIPMNSSQFNGNGFYNQTPVINSQVQQSDITHQTVDASTADADDDRMSISSGGSDDQKIEVNSQILRNDSSSNLNNMSQSSANFISSMPPLVSSGGLNQWQAGMANSYNANYSNFTNFMGHSGMDGMYNPNFYDQYGNSILNNNLNNQSVCDNSGTSIMDEASEKKFMSVLENFVKELKQVMQKDLCKKMVENSAFKSFDSWWTGEEEKNKVIYLYLISRDRNFYHVYQFLFCLYL